jgi:hypothetical protein
MKPVLLTQVLLAPALARGLSLGDWDLLIRQGRRANLLAWLLKDDLATVPEAPRRHLEAALLVARRQGETTHWEVACIRAALAPLGVQPILLKGAAYLMAGLPASRGRLFGDVDILVPRERIEAVEAALIEQGWRFSDELTDYDQRYYRDWMHEIPPLGHEQRGTALDVHHTILPPTARMQVNTAALFEDCRALPGTTGVQVLAPTAMFLHSATHLFHEGELDKGLRDLFDLDALLRDFGRDPAFWPALLPRARHLGLTRPLFYALHYTHRHLVTPMPAGLLAEVQAAAAPPGWVLTLMDFCYDRALRPAHASCDTGFTPLARLAVYVRSHALRMPLGLLAGHLLRKAWLKLTAPAVVEPTA